MWARGPFPQVHGLARPAARPLSGESRPSLALSTQGHGSRGQRRLRSWAGGLRASRWEHQDGCIWVWRTDWCIWPRLRDRGLVRNWAGSTEAAGGGAKTELWQEATREARVHQPPRDLGPQPPTARMETSTSGVSRARGTGPASFPECRSHGPRPRGHACTEHKRNGPTGMTTPL